MVGSAWGGKATVGSAGTTGASLEVLVPEADGGAQRIAGLKAAAGGVSGGDRKRGPDAMDILIGVGAVGRGEIFLLVDDRDGGIDESRASLERGGVHREEEVHLFLDWDLHRVLQDGRLPRHLAVGRHRCEPDRLGL